MRCTILTNSSGLCTGRGRNNTASTTLKMTVPMPNARSTAIARVEPGFLASMRAPKRRSFIGFYFRQLEKERDQGVARGRGRPPHFGQSVIRYLSATIGSTRLARLAGYQLASIWTQAFLTNNPATSSVQYAIGSFACRQASLSRYLCFLPLRSGPRITPRPRRRLRGQRFSIHHGRRAAAPEA